MADALYSFVAEPRGEAYEGLVHLALAYCTQILVVVRDDLGETEGLAAVLRELGAEGRRASSWPGTRLFGAEATAYVAPLSPRTVEILCTTTDRLFGWRQPELPEDLCFLRADGSEWLTSIAHEADAYLTLKQEEVADLARRDPTFWAGLLAETSDS